jgi:hypothetical protein
VECGIYFCDLRCCSWYICSQLKTTYNAIQEYCSHTSGFHWDHDRGANIEGVAADQVWQSYILTKVCHGFSKIFPKAVALMTQSLM